MASLSHDMATHRSDSMVSLPILATLASVACALPTVLNLSPKHVEYPVQSCTGVSEFQYFSCNSPKAVSNSSCCYEDFGIILQSQFWNFDPENLKIANGTSKSKRSSRPRQKAVGDPDNVFTIHGLWNDLCDGSYSLYCVPDLEFKETDDLKQIISDDFARSDLYNFMSRYWISNPLSGVSDSASQSLWLHEYNKHGTCFNTLQPKCFQGTYKKHEAAVAYYQKCVEVWTTLPTFQFLQDAKIVPTTQQKYSLKDVELALAAAHGGNLVHVGCTNGSISEIWYYYQVKGNALTGTYKPTDSLGKSNCPSQVWYLPK